MKAAIPDPIS